MRPLIHRFRPLRTVTRGGSIVGAVLAVALSAASPARAAGQQCDPARPLDTPTKNFEIKGATAIDSLTGLEWQRCAHGLTWSDGACTGTRKGFTLSEALAAAEAAGDGWRLPSAQEMDSILESACTGPAINLDVFPDVRPTADDSEDDWVFWSTTHYDIIPEMAYIFNFATGIADVRSPAFPLSVRLVRPVKR